jgi:hypothetical protein
MPLAIPRMDAGEALTAVIEGSSWPKPWPNRGPVPVAADRRRRQLADWDGGGLADRDGGLAPRAGDHCGRTERQATDR